MKTVELKLKNEEGKLEKFHLRLTAGSQKQIKLQKGEILGVIMEASTDIETAILLLDFSLSYPKNDNTITDGEEFYDLLVDNDYEGSSAFAKLFTDIAVASGIISKPQANKIVKLIDNTYNDIFDSLDDIKVDSIKEEALKADETPTEETPL